MALECHKHFVHLIMNLKEMLYSDQGRLLLLSGLRIRSYDDYDVHLYNRLYTNMCFYKQNSLCSLSEAFVVLSRLRYIRGMHRLLSFCHYQFNHWRCCFFRFVSISLGLSACNSSGHLSNHAEVAPNHAGISFAISNTLVCTLICDSREEHNSSV